MSFDEKMKELYIRLNRLGVMSDNLTVLRDGFLREEENLSDTTLSDLEKSEKLLIQAGVLNEILMVLNESSITTTDYMKSLIVQEEKELEEKGRKYSKDIS